MQQRGLRRTWRSAAVLLAIAAGTLTASSSALAARAHPHVTGVTFSGSQAAPTITVTGTSFGKKPPKSFSAATTSCGAYGPGNGSWFGKSGLWFQDDTHDWQAGAGTSTGGNCIGIVVDSWSDTSVTLHFGVAYGSFDHWTADPGDNFVIDVEGYYWGGLVSYS